MYTVFVSCPTVNLQLVLKKWHSVDVRNEQNGVTDVGTLHAGIRVIDLYFYILDLLLDRLNQRSFSVKRYSLPLIFLNSPAGVPSLLTVGHEVTGFLANTVAIPTNATASNFVKMIAIS